MCSRRAPSAPPARYPRRRPRRRDSRSGSAARALRTWGSASCARSNRRCRRAETTRSSGSAYWASPEPQPSTPRTAARGGAASLPALVLVEHATRLFQRIAPERVAELARAHQLDHRHLAFALRLARGAQRRADIRDLVYADSFGAHRPGDRGEARVLQVHPEEAVRIEVDVILLLGAPLLVIEHHRGDRDLL